MGNPSKFRYRALFRGVYSVYWEDVYLGMVEKVETNRPYWKVDFRSGARGIYDLRESAAWALYDQREEK